jgi:hypothetical protein
VEEGHERIPQGLLALMLLPDRLDVADDLIEGILEPRRPRCCLCHGRRDGNES